MSDITRSFIGATVRKRNYFTPNVSYFTLFWRCKSISIMTKCSEKKFFKRIIFLRYLVLCQQKSSLKQEVRWVMFRKAWSSFASSLWKTCRYNIGISNIGISALFSISAYRLTANNFYADIVHQIPQGNIGILAKVKYRQSAYRQKSNIGTSLEVTFVVLVSMRCPLDFVISCTKSKVKVKKFLLGRLLNAIFGPLEYTQIKRVPQGSHFGATYFFECRLSKCYHKVYCEDLCTCSHPVIMHNFRLLSNKLVLIEFMTIEEFSCNFVAV